MRKIIKNKMYDTGTAKYIAVWCNDQRGFEFIRERLYQKKTGEYFLHGEGGAMTGYAEYIGNGYIEGEKIMPLTDDEAMKWAEKHLEANEYEEIFGEVSESDRTFAIKLKDARKSIGLTQAGLSEILEVPKRTLEDWERGYRNPPAYVEKLILDKLSSMK